MVAHMTASMKALSEAVAVGRSAGGRLRGRARAEVARLIEQARREGETYGAMAAMLGVSEQTVTRWQMQSKDVELAQVRVAETARRELVVHGPGGLRIEGLSLEEIAALLGKLSS